MYFLCFSSLKNPLMSFSDQISMFVFSFGKTMKQGERKAEYWLIRQLFETEVRVASKGADTARIWFCLVFTIGQSSSTDNTHYRIMGQLFTHSVNISKRNSP